jgi:Sensor_kinase_SpoOB-type, alpha-helical domain
LTDSRIATVKEHIHHLTNHLQVILGYLEVNQPDKAMGMVRVAIKELTGLRYLLAAEHTNRKLIEEHKNLDDKG